MAERFIHKMVDKFKQLDTVDTAESSVDQDWQELLPSVKRSNFYSFSVSNFNIYYLVAATTLVVGGVVAYMSLKQEIKPSNENEKLKRYDTTEVRAPYQPVESKSDTLVLTVPKTDVPPTKVNEIKPVKASIVVPSETVSPDPQAPEVLPQVADVEDKVDAVEKVLPTIEQKRDSVSVEPPKDVTSPISAPPRRVQNNKRKFKVLKDTVEVIDKKK